jgi:hypothetical protein
MLEGSEAVTRALTLVAASFQAAEPLEAIAIAEKYLMWVNGELEPSELDLGTPVGESSAPSVDLDKIREETMAAAERRRQEREEQKLHGFV